ncbi:MAG: galactofuranose transport system permease protein [Actinomycetota bacterium]|nr:galactofuranose transport system permease protein [Actinomycetota bacterium]
MTATKEVLADRVHLPVINGNWIRDKGVYLALILLVLYNVAFTNNFNHFDSLQTLMKQVPAILIVSLGMLMVIGTGGIDLSFGATMSIAGSVLGIVISPAKKGCYHQGMFIADALALLAGLAVGLFNGYVIAVGGVQPIVATLSLLVAGRGIALVITSGGLIELFNPTLNKLGSGFLFKIPYSMVIAIVLVVLVAVLVRRTVLGYRLLAIGGNRRASVLAGLPVRRTIITVYALSGLFAAVAGIIGTARIQSADPSYLGILYELQAITAVVVGGTALSGGRVRVMGTLAGVFLMQLLENTLKAHNIPDSGTRMVQAVVIIAAVLIQRNRSNE